MVYERFFYMNGGNRNLDVSCEYFANLGLSEQYFVRLYLCFILAKLFMVNLT